MPEEREGDEWDCLFSCQQAVWLDHPVFQNLFAKIWIYLHCYFPPQDTLGCDACRIFQGKEFFLVLSGE